MNGRDTQKERRDRERQAWHTDKKQAHGETEAGGQRKRKHRLRMFHRVGERPQNGGCF